MFSYEEHTHAVVDEYTRALSELLLRVYAAWVGGWVGGQVRYQVEDARFDEALVVVGALVLDDLDGDLLLRLGIRALDHLTEGSLTQEISHDVSRCEIIIIVVVAVSSSHTIGGRLSRGAQQQHTWCPSRIPAHR